MIVEHVRVKYIRLSLISLFFIGCTEELPCQCRDILNIKQQHAIRVYVTIKCYDNREIIKSLHWSNTMYCNNKMYYIGDYISGYGSKVF